MIEKLEEYKQSQDLAASVRNITFCKEVFFKINVRYFCDALPGLIIGLKI